MRAPIRFSACSIALFIPTLGCGIFPTTTEMNTSVRRVVDQALEQARCEADDRERRIVRRIDLRTAPLPEIRNDMRRIACAMLELTKPKKGDVNQ